MSVRVALGIGIFALLLELGLARVLDSIGLIEGLLSPSGASSALLLPLSVVFYAARLTTWFVAPGVLLGALCVSFRLNRRERN
jgi:hypothetical protein